MKLRHVRLFVEAIIAIFVGFAIYFYVCNLEDDYLYKFRSLITGRTGIRAVSEHPIDRYIGPSVYIAIVLTVFFVTAGASNILLRSRKTNSEASERLPQ
jgi:hypothetical protein